jgi:hypothetical protein
VSICTYSFRSYRRCCVWWNNTNNKNTRTLHHITLVDRQPNAGLMGRKKNTFFFVNVQSVLCKQSTRPGPTSFLNHYSYCGYKLLHGIRIMGLSDIRWFPSKNTFWVSSILEYNCGLFSVFLTIQYCQLLQY